VNSNNPLSPKVLWPVILGVVLSAVVSNASAITPEMLNFLGPWKFFVLGVGLSILNGVTGWYAKDPLRTPAVEAKPTDPTAVAAQIASLLKPPTT
jgi:hypothetical protein